MRVISALEPPLLRDSVVRIEAVKLSAWWIFAAVDVSSSLRLDLAVASTGCCGTVCLKTGQPSFVVLHEIPAS